MTNKSAHNYAINGAELGPGNYHAIVGANRGEGKIPVT